LERYLNATGDVEFLIHEGAEMMVETARLWEDLGFYATNGDASFHIHSVTGPDEYTTVVNDNTYTNMMARFNLSFAAKAVEFIADWETASFDRLRRRTGLDRSEIAAWHRAADAMFIPYDETLGIHPQDTNFLERERWDFENTPSDRYPLLLNYHPLVIYRFQVLKQADVVLAMYMRSESFTRDEKRRDFDYYDPITTNDSSLSACVQAIVAAEIGHDSLAFEYFQHALFLDLCNLHGNTPDGVHIASCGGVWAALVHGFAGMVDNGEWLRFEPRLPAAWTGITFRVLRHGARLVVDVDADGCTVMVETAPGAPIQTADGVVRLNAGEQVRIQGAQERSDE
jgi:alpha,alpha-trehalose phosphorylase